MCGIAGFLGSGSREVLLAMTRALQHRGPDAEGLHVDEARRIYLGHRRLAIIDPARGQQPMWNEDGTVAVVFNGEIYNHRALRTELEAAGHRFGSDHSDTEVLVHGFEEWDTGLLSRLNGMFAFAVYDARRRQLLLARDRFGEKPLYYACGRDVFAFASEVRALLHHPRVDSALDETGVQKFFAHGYFPGEHTLHRGITRLPGGCWLRVATDDLAAARPQRYWAFTLEPDRSLTDRDEPRLVEELRALIVQAVARRLESDVPLGVFLSGGVDSSAVLAGMLKSVDPARIRAFTLGFTEPSFDESGPARTMATHAGIVHEERVLSVDTARALLPALLGRLDEPSGDASLLPTYLLCRYTREQVTVALSGDGGDELFAGYDPFLALAPAAAYARVVPAPLHRLIRRAAGALPTSYANMSLDFKLKRTLMGLSYERALWNPAWMSPVEPDDLARMFHCPLPAEEIYSEAIASWNREPGLDVVDRTLEYYTRHYLQDDILVKADRASMLVSLETRSAFLDNDLVEFCRRLPHHFKLRRGQRKYLLRRALRGLVPDRLLARRKKGFGMPIGKWLRSGALDESTAAVPGVRPEWIAARWQEHRAGAADHRLLLWCWLSLAAVLAQADAGAGLRGAA